jgi:hypothetical protein
MINLKPNVSPITTVLIIIALIGVIYYILFEIFIYYAPCVQRNTGVVNFNLLFTCVDYLEKNTLAYLAVCLLALLMIKGNSIFNSKGLLVSRVIMLLVLIAFFTFYAFNLL